MSKKTEKIEVRVSQELKDQLCAHSAKHGRTISDTVRLAIDSEFSSTATTNILRRNQQMSGKLIRATLATTAVLVVGTIASISFQTDAVAQADVRVAFADLDRDENGVISREEFETSLAPDFATFGAVETNIVDVEGSLPEACEAEFALDDSNQSSQHFFTEELPAEDEFLRFDADMNTEISFSEFRSRFRQDAYEVFMMLDKDGNQILSRGEMSEQDAAMGEAISEACMAALNKSLGVEDADFEVDVNHMERLEFAALDENRDGGISLDEFIDH